jgi:hypothetical protein
LNKFEVLFDKARECLTGLWSAVVFTTRYAVFAYSVPSQAVVEQAPRIHLLLPSLYEVYFNRLKKYEGGPEGFRLNQAARKLELESKATFTPLLFSQDFRLRSDLL